MFEKFKERVKNIFSLDLRSLALTRVALGVVLLCDIANRSRYVLAGYTDLGIFPRSVAVGFYDNPWVFSFHLLNGSWQIQLLLLCVAMIFAVMLILGYKTKLATIVSWVLLISLQTRNPLILQGGDVVMRLGLFWGMFLPWGEYFSLDVVYRSVKAPRNIFSAPRYISGATVAFIFQISFIYWFAFLFKTGPEWIQNGTAVYYALSLDQFATYFGHFLLNFPHLLVFMTFASLALEGLGPFLFFVPFWTDYLKLLGVLLFVSFHFGLFLAMHLGPFPFVCMAVLVGLLPPLFWESVIAWHKKRKASIIKIYYDGECGFCKKITHFLRVFFLLSKEDVSSATEHKAIFAYMLEKHSWVIVDSKGTKHIKFDGFITIAKASPVFFIIAPLLHFSFVHKIGDWLYDYFSIHNKKQCFPQPLESSEPSPFYRRASYITMSIVAFLLIGYVFLWNIMELYPNLHVLSKPMQDLGMFLRIDQRWDMFAPFPLKDDGWYVIPGNLKNHQMVDLFTSGQAVSYEKPQDVAGMYDGERWRKYMMNLYLAKNSQYRLYYGQYLCRTWNGTHLGDEQLLNFDIIYMLEKTLPDYQPSLVKPVTLWHHECF